MALSPQPNEEILEELFQCTKCGKMLPTKQLLNRHQRFYHTPKKNSCEICNKTFKKQKYLLHHKEHKHENHTLKIKCPLCSIGLRSNHHKKLHLNRHRKVLYDCEKCGKKFAEIGSVQRHINEVHNAEKVVCNKCGKTYSCQRKLKVHVNSVHNKGEKCECSVCGKKFTHRIFLKRHFTNFHSNVSAFKCGLCGKLYLTEDSVYSHMRWKHANTNTNINFEDYVKKIVHFATSEIEPAVEETAEIEAPEVIIIDDDVDIYRDHEKKHKTYKTLPKKKSSPDSEPKNELDCTKCSKTLPTKALLDRHTNFYHCHTKNKCVFCTQGFMTTLFLHRHIHEKHMRHTLGVQCPFCPETEQYDQNDTFQWYIQNHKTYQRQKIPKDRISLEEEEKDGHTSEQVVIQGSYACMTCGKSFPCGFDLSEHLEDHKRSNSCTVCFQEFKNESDLINHLLTHGNEKLYKCIWCPLKVYKQFELLKTHHNKEHGDKNFFCESCNNFFKSGEELELHVKETKPFKCKECDVKFEQDCGLPSHYLSHGIDKTFFCEFCKSGFHLEGQLNNHLYFCGMIYRPYVGDVEYGV